MDSLHKRRRKQVALVATGAFLLVAMILYNALKPSTAQADQVDELSTAIVNTDWEHSTPEERQAMREEWEALPPATRREVFLAVARHRLKEMRERTKGLTPEERTEKIREATRRLRAEHEKITPEERAHVRERLHSAEGQEMVRAAMDLYLNEFTARERAQLDPHVHEWLYQVERLSK